MGLLDGFKGMLADYTPDLLPEDPDKRAAARQGLLAAGAAMMSSKGQNFFGTLGQGLLAGGENYQGALQQQQQDRLRKAQQERWELENQQSKTALDRKREEDGIIAGFGDPDSISGAAGVQPTSSGAQSPTGRAPGAASVAGAPAGGYSTSYNGTPYSPDEASAAARAVMGMGINDLAPDRMNQVMALARQGMGVDQAAKMVFGGSAAPAPMGRTPMGPPPDLPRIGQPRRPPAIDSSLEGAPGAQDEVGATGTLPSTFAPGLPPSPALPALDDLPKKGQPRPANFAREAYERNLAIANRLLEKKHVERANEYFAKAEKFAPEVKDTVPMRTRDGRQVMVNRFKDGSMQEVEDYLPEEPKLTYQDIGSETLGLDPKGNVVVRFKNGERPGSRARGAGGGAGGADPGQVENVAQMIASGRMAPMGQMALRSPFGAAVMSRVSQINPDYRAQDFGITTKSEKDFATGKLGSTVRSFNVSLSHLDTLDQLADALHSNDAKALNKVSNSFKAQFGNAAPTSFDAAKKVVADEVVKAIVGTGGGVHDREEAARVIDAANSPEQLKGVIGTYKELMRGQLHGLEQQYRVSTGRNDFNKYLSQAAMDGEAPPDPTKPNNKVTPLKEVPKKPPAIGTVDAGHRFKGGNPADKANWEKVR